MITLIVGAKGAGKTKSMIDMINEAAKTAHGNIVCIEKNMKHTYDIDHAVRLIHLDEFNINNYEDLCGFISGLLAGNYDIQEIYIDGILRVTDGDLEGLGDFLDKLNGIAKENVKVIITVSAEEAQLPEAVKKYL